MLAEVLCVSNELAGRGVPLELTTQALQATAHRACDPNRLAACYSWLVVRGAQVLLMPADDSFLQADAAVFLERHFLELEADGLGDAVGGTLSSIQADIPLDENAMTRLAYELHGMAATTTWTTPEYTTTTAVEKVFAEFKDVCDSMPPNAGRIWSERLRVACIHRLRLFQFDSSAGSSAATAAGGVDDVSCVVASQSACPSGDSGVAAADDPAVVDLVPAQASPEASAAAPPPPKRLPPPSAQPQLLFERALEFAHLGLDLNDARAFFEGDDFRQNFNESDSMPLLRCAVARWYELLRKASQSPRCNRTMLALAEQPKLVRLVLDAVPDPNMSVCAFGGTALIFAVAQSATLAQPPLQVIELLLDRSDGQKCCDVNATTTGFFLSPLMVACDLGLADVAQVLVDRGADVNLKDGWGYTALHRVCLTADQPQRRAQNRIELIKLLISNGANLASSVDEPYEDHFLPLIPFGVREDFLLDRVPMPTLVTPALLCALHKLPDEARALLPLDKEHLGGTWLFDYLEELQAPAPALEEVQAHAPSPPPYHPIPAGSLPATAGGGAHALEPQRMRKRASSPRLLHEPSSKRMTGTGALRPTLHSTEGGLGAALGAAGMLSAARAGAAAAATTAGVHLAGKSYKDFIGVRAPDTRRPGGNIYGADINFCGRSVYLGIWETPGQAAEAYDFAARMVSNRALNFSLDTMLSTKPRDAAIETLQQLVEYAKSLPAGSFSHAPLKLTSESLVHWRADCLMASFVKGGHVNTDAELVFATRTGHACSLLRATPSREREEAAARIELASAADGRTLFARQGALLELIENTYPPASPSDALFEATKVSTNSAGGGSTFRWLLGYAYANERNGKKKIEELLGKGYNSNASGQAKARIQEELLARGDPKWTDGLGSVVSDDDAGETVDDKDEEEESESSTKEDNKEKSDEVEEGDYDDESVMPCDKDEDEEDEASEMSEEEDVEEFKESEVSEDEEDEEEDDDESAMSEDEAEGYRAKEGSEEEGGRGGNEESDHDELAADVQLNGDAQHGEQVEISATTAALMADGSNPAAGVRKADMPTPHPPRHQQPGAVWSLPLDEEDADADSDMEGVEEVMRLLKN